MQLQEDNLKAKVAQKEALDKAKKEMKITKDYYDKMARELDTVKLVEDRLKAKKYFAEACEYLQKETTAQKAAADKLLQLWVEVTKSTTTPQTCEALNVLTNNLTSAKADTEKDYKRYATEVLGEFGKIR